MILPPIDHLIKATMRANPPKPFVWDSPWYKAVGDAGYDAISAAAGLVNAAEAADRGDASQLIASLEALENTVYQARAAVEAALFKARKGE